MLNRAVRGIVVSALSLGLVAGTGLEAWAADEIPVGGDGSVGCNSSGVCGVEAGSPGSSASPGSASGSGGSGSSSGSPGVAASPQPTLVNGACTYAPDPGFVVPASDTSDQHAGQAGAWYLMTCPDDIRAGTDIATTTSTDVWLTTPPATLPAAAVLAQRAVKLLRLPSPELAGSPKLGGAQMVRVPVWFWTDRAMWSARSATASVPGESVSVTATPVGMSFDFGDGTSGTCGGPGTPYVAGDDPSAASPDCGHTYQQDSGSEPGGVFAVTASVVWRITWVGAGQVGALNSVTTAVSLPLRVEESEAIVVRS